MIYNENIVSLVQPLLASGSAANLTKTEVNTFGDLLNGFMAHSTTQGIYFRLLDDGMPIMPVSGFFYVPADLPITVFFDRQFLGKITLEAYNPGASNSDLSLNLFLGTAKEKDLNLKMLDELQLIRQTLQAHYTGKPPFKPPEVKEIK